MAVILIVEDEKGINELIKRSLQLVGHHSLQAFTGREAMGFAENHSVDLILLDVNLPDYDGFRLFEFFNGIPVIFVTAKDDISDRVRGLNIGAQDYIVKPFDIQELVARVQASLRRQNKEESSFRIGNIRIDFKRCVATTENGSAVALTNQEFELLRVLILNRNIALSRARLLELAWGIDYEGEERTVDVHIQRLRKKLNLEQSIKTVFKVGYRLEL